MTSIFIAAFFIGMIFNASPGAVFTESLRRGIKGGYYPALYVQLGSLVGDATWAVLGLCGVGFLFQIPGVKLPLTILGAIYLFYLGFECLMAAIKSHNIDSHATLVQDLVENEDGSSNHSSFFSGATISLTNPANVIYWAALGGVLGTLGVSTPSPKDYITFFSGFMFSSFVWCFVCAGLIHIMHKSFSPRVSKFLDLICAITLFYLAYKSIASVLLL